MPIPYQYFTAPLYLHHLFLISLVHNMILSVILAPHIYLTILISAR